MFRVSSSGQDYMAYPVLEIKKLFLNNQAIRSEELIRAIFMI